nr:uncharacterized protein LOC128672900 isoform X2 [Plodia interpunctella]
MPGDDNLAVPSARSVSPSRKAINSNISDLKKQRGVLRGRLTQFSKYLDLFENNSPSKLQIKEIKFRMQAAIDIYQNFNKINSEILCLSDESVDNEYVESFESLYFSALANAECLIESDETGDSSSDFRSSSNTSKPRAHVKLPEIKLPTFDGQYDQWLEYRNSYITMIHKRTDLDAIQKFHYLRSSLSGSALQVISALEFTASNYQHAWELLENRFHNARLLVHNHIKSLFSLSNIKQESASLIRKLIDTVLRNLRALKTLEEPVDTWDTLLIYLIVSKLDLATESDWEKHKGTLVLNSSRKLKLDDLLRFLRNKADMLDMISANHNKLQSKPTNNATNQANNKVHSYVSTNNSNSKNKFTSNNNKRHKCPSCNGNHALYMCYNFLNLSVQDRSLFVDKNNLCRNCLRSGHVLSDCTFGPCKQCQGKHNSLLHFNSSNKNSVNSDAMSSSPQATSMPTAALLSVGGDPFYSNTYTCAGDLPLQPVLLCTALVDVIDKDNRMHTARALLDSGSQHSFILDRLRKRLNAPLIQSTIRISGVGQSVSHSNHLCEITFKSKICDYTAKARCIVLQRITNGLPTTCIDEALIRMPNNIQLADPSFCVPSDIDLLIGADLFWSLLCENRIQLSNGPCLQNSKLGWLISGPINNNKILSTNLVHCHLSQTLSEQLTRFWEIEEMPQSGSPLTNDERLCEDLFVKTTIRMADGRFSVRIPLKESADSLGDSYTLAKNRFFSLERKLERSPDYKRMYVEFMREYEALGHMERIDMPKSPNYFLPHHGVYREGAVTTKLRVVFNASAVTTSNKSLNDIQLPGPALQNDIFGILLRFRQYKYVACADVCKMFRQVMVQSDQRSLQLIVWRENPTDPLQVYQLTCVTYGTASAPYLSMRCIRQLASECEDKFVARVINDDFFVDDLITGHDNYKTLLDICEKTRQVLQSGCFPLRKWTFNSDVTRCASIKNFEGEHTQNKTLGVGWNSDSDELHFTTKIDFNSDNSKLNKRQMLSIIAQIYDPLGLLSASIIIAKILLQKLWANKLSWDDEVPQDIAESWNYFIGTLKCLSELKIPRCVLNTDRQYTELHIFCDASSNAYGACAYIRTYSDGSSNPTVRLLCAKTKVAPLKSLTIPRLELCGAYVGAKLYKHIVDSLRLSFTKTYFWTDSTIVLGWLQMSPHLLKTFVQTRVAKIKNITEESEWLHVPSKDNPADLLSRGVYLNLLIDNNLWWNGPYFLQSREFSLDFIRDNNESVELNDLPELKPPTKVSFVCIPVENDLFEFKRYSSYIKLLRIGAFVLRFIDNIRSRHQSVSKQQTGFLTTDELRASQALLVKCAQRESFPDVYDNLLNNTTVKTNKSQWNRLSGLNLFLDDRKVIRVGGRLSNSSDFNYDKKHPVLLCNKHYFTLLLVRYEHRRLLHAGPQLLLSSLRECWWPLSARNLVKKIVRECVTCARIKGKMLSPIMGNLPSERLDGGFPFITTGCDYCGPLFILNRKGRGAQLTKAPL